MIILTQIKAARALLGWTQEHLAKATQLSLPAINNLERGLTSPRRETLAAIEKTFIAAGIDFIDQTGVRLRPPELDVKIIEGSNWLKIYDDLIMTHLQSAEDEICQFSCDERLWMVHGATTNHHYIHHRNKIRFKERILIPKSAHFITNERYVYRQHADELFANTSWQVFKGFVAHILWNRQQILLTQSVALADTHHKIFNTLWISATPFTDKGWATVEKWEAKNT